VPLVGNRHFGSHDKGTPEISCCTSSVPRGLAMIPAFAAGMLDGKPTVLQYIPGRHVLTADLALRLRGEYPQSGEIEIEVETEQTSIRTLVLRIPEWAEGFIAEVDGQSYRPQGSRLLEIEREWSAGDIVNVRIPLHLRLVEDGDATTSSMGFMRGPQVLATDTAIEGCETELPSDWWGNDLYAGKCQQDGTEKVFHLTPFADAGQHMEEYAALHEGIDSAKVDSE